jgi:hypothetical protein
VFESFGVVAEVVSDDPELFDSLPCALPPGWTPGNGKAATRFGLMRDGAITLDGTEVARSNGDRSASLVRLSATVRHHVALHAPAHVFIHAGVVCVGCTAIVIPGSSRSGKTTLVAELVRTGATYYSDDYAVVDSGGLMHPYAKPLSIRSAGPGPGWPVPVPEAQVASRPIRAGLIVLTSYDAGAPWRPTACTSGEGALALLQHTVAARSRPRHALAAVCQLSRDARVIAGRRGEASVVAQALLDDATSSSSSRAGVDGAAVRRKFDSPDVHR